MARLPAIAGCGCIFVRTDDNPERKELKARVDGAITEFLRTKRRTTPSRADERFAAGNVQVEQRRGGRVVRRSDQ